MDWETSPQSQQVILSGYVLLLSKLHILNQCMIQLSDVMCHKYLCLGLSTHVILCLIVYKIIPPVTANRAYKLDKADNRE